MTNANSTHIQLGAPMKAVNYIMASLYSFRYLFYLSVATEIKAFYCSHLNCSFHFYRLFVCLSIYFYFVQSYYHLFEMQSLLSIQHCDACLEYILFCFRLNKMNKHS